MTMGDVIGACEIGSKKCSIKKIDQQDSVIIFITEKGSDTPISGSQVKIQKNPFGVAL